jgi:radical SAM superfamily enzyme YgiQ (UPF0313 family)
MNKIGWLTFGRDDFSYGLALAMSSIDPASLYRVTPKTAKLVDYLLLSCFWWEHTWILADFMRRAGIKKKTANRPKIIVGGFNSFNPVPLSCYADFVVCGDGEGTIAGILTGEKVDYTFIGEGCSTWNNVSELKPFINQTSSITRMEIARGCRFRCKFCAVAHLKPYRELPLDEIESGLRLTKTKRVSLFAPEPTLHSQDEEITALCHRYGKLRVDSDVRLDRLSKRSDSVPRVGIEGISERLRRSVNKPYTNQQIIEAVKQAIIDGRRGLFMYFILDLPGEADRDWDEFAQLLRDIGRLKGAQNFLLKPSPSVFLPTPHTPMEYEGIHWERPYGQQWETFFGRGDARQWEVLMAERARVFSPAMRILSMVSTRAGTEFADIEEELTRGKIIGVSGGRPHCKDLNGLLRVLKKYGGVEKYCGPYPAGDAPWKLLQLGKLSLKSVREVVEESLDPGPTG